MMFRTGRLVAACALAILFSAAEASATQRHFTYTYESPVLNPGDAELEPWTTFKWGRDNYYSSVEQRLEFEIGVVPNLQTSLYWNFAATSQDVTDATGVEARQTEFELESISSEWKYRLSDPVADPLGSSLYLEGALGPTEAEIEAKVILDKRIGQVLLAANLVGEYEWIFDEANKTERELAFELNLGGGYFFTDTLFAGLELMSQTELEHAEELENSVLYAGPTFGYSPGSWWMAMTVMPQIVALKGASQGSSLDLEHHERLQTRFLFGFDL